MLPSNSTNTVINLVLKEKIKKLKKFLQRLKEPAKPLTMQNQDDYVVPDFSNISSKDILKRTCLF